MIQALHPSALHGLDLVGRVQLINTMTSAVTANWGVDWNETYIARDLMQNFYDANRDCLSEVRVHVEGPDVIISAPTSFNLDRLYYLGSEKGEDDVGEYGEGFKVAATCLLRDHRVTPIAVSGHDLLVLRLADEAVRNTELRPLVYDYHHNDLHCPGTKLVLRGCSKKLAQALTVGLSHFLYPENPLLGKPRWRSANGHFSIYDSTDERGHVFYLKLKRGEMEDVPLVLVLDKPYGALDKKVAQDRDRKAFGTEVMRLFHDHFARYGLRYFSEAQRVVVEAAKPFWGRGHPLSAALAKSSCDAWTAQATREVFGNGYYAESTSGEPAEQLGYDGLEREWRQAGRTRLPKYFAAFGVLNAEQHLRDSREKALAEAKRAHRRAQTAAELVGLDLLGEVTHELAPAVMGLFDKKTTSYTVAPTEALLGQFKLGRSYGSKEVFLAESVFVADLAGALATFLHEHAHIFGDDGEQGFSDALTEMLETVIRQRRELERYEAEWEKAAAVEQERGKAQEEEGGPETWLVGKSEEELREVLLRLPAVVLRRALAEKPEAQEQADED